MWSIKWWKQGHQSCLNINSEIKYGLKQPTLSSDIRRPSSPPNVMDPSGSSKKSPLLHIKFNCPCHGAYMTCSTPPSFHHIKKPQHMDLTSPNHHLIWLTEKRSTKWSVSSTTDIMVRPDNSNIWSSGKDTLKVTTHENQLTKCMLRSSSNFIINTCLWIA